MTEHHHEHGWTRLGTEIAHEGPHLTVHRDRVVQPHGAEGTYEHVEMADGARIVMVDGRRRVAFVEDAFYPLGARLLHVPGGAIGKGEDPLDAARRECEEETGWCPRELRHLTAFHPLPSRTAAVVHLYLAMDLFRGTVRRDPTEAGMTLRWLPFEEAVDAVRSGEISEAASVIGVLLAERALTP
ncbi:NUDIX domain-containing protein [Streptomyces albireticuli]|uniref:Hydrolase n=1 Tax=Streptomyces albireticuli TaxID=1940 RepID=A0A2A2D8R9_9ACTN|nr:NUDIX hydrolase [Streptomyces albireticuli]MCD9145081.1 NUDIX hydrolase [Streptomyces albireticuli]MCD9164507.1 NUDIX hydrolase [Streptomyces albireticuli]MCD9194218.1 NUDIX hydrolase [Streptomyces albireticuli]PAU48883.1 hydrolase [Streptomyces albireticuli]